jgi:hypothetical protein
VEFPEHFRNHIAVIAAERCDAPDFQHPQLVFFQPANSFGKFFAEKVFIEAYFGEDFLGVFKHDEKVLTEH